MLRDRKPVPPQARDIAFAPEGELAEDRIRYIRNVMARASTFTAVPGWGMLTMGATALCAAIAASGYLESTLWLWIWAIEAIVASTIGWVALARKAKKAGIPLISGSGRQFIMSFLPSLLVGFIVCVGLWNAGLENLMPGIWMLMYGNGTLASGAYSVKVIPVMGASFIFTGALALFLPLAWSNGLMALSFGGYHLLFGYWIAKQYGG